MSISFYIFASCDIGIKTDLKNRQTGIKRNAKQGFPILFARRTPLFAEVFHAPSIFSSVFPMQTKRKRKFCWPIL